MIDITALRPCAGGMRLFVLGRHGRLACCGSMPALSTLTSSNSSDRSSPTAGARIASPALGPLALPSLHRRSMSTSSGGGSGRRKDATGPPDVITGFGRRHKPVDGGNTALGKGFDLMEDDPRSRKKIVIGGYDPHGFQLEDGVDVRGSMICMPNSFVLWQPKRQSEITIESLRVVELVIPKIDLIILGVGEKMTARLDPALVKHLGAKGIRVEQMDSVNACSTFNVLNAEDRRVAAALLQLFPEEEDNIPSNTK